MAWMSPVAVWDPDTEDPPQPLPLTAAPAESIPPAPAPAPAPTGILALVRSHLSARWPYRHGD
jgi:hypothetical protein